MFETLIASPGRKSHTNPLQAVVMAHEHDTYLGGPDLAAEAQSRLLAAVGRLFGYRARYEKYSGPEAE
jgi:hypothetical protein